MSIQTSVDSVVQTTTDKKIEQAKHIYAIAERFIDASGVLEDLCSVYLQIRITFSNALDTLCAKERTCITTETKDPSFAVAR